MYITERGREAGFSGLGRTRFPLERSRLGTVSVGWDDEEPTTEFGESRRSNDLDVHRLHLKPVKTMQRIRTSRLDVDPEAIEAFCRRHHIKRLAFFGSVLRDDFHPDSDVDVLVEFEAGHTPGWEIFDIQDELADLLGREVDLSTFAGIRPHARTDILGSAQIQYEA